MNQPRTGPIHLVWEWLSAQAACHSFIPALLGMMIGSQSTSNRWIGAQLGWLSGAAVYARVLSVASGGARPCAAHSLCTPVSVNNGTSVLLHLPSHWNSEFPRSSPALPCSLTAVLAAWLQSRTAFRQTSILDFCDQIVITTQAESISAEISTRGDITRAVVVKDGGVYERC